MDTLFPMPQPELNLEIQDKATSDNPLIIYLQRKGWTLKRIQELQDSISDKLTVDMFTSQTKPLSAGEKELQRDIQQFLDMQ